MPPPADPLYDYWLEIVCVSDIPKNYEVGTLVNSILLELGQFRTRPLWGNGQCQMDNFYYFTIW